MVVVREYYCDDCGAGPLEDPNVVTDLHDNETGSPAIDAPGPMNYTAHYCDRCVAGVLER